MFNGIKDFFKIKKYSKELEQYVQEMRSYTEEVKEYKQKTKSLDEYLNNCLNEYLAQPCIESANRFRHKIKLVFAQTTWKRKELEDIKRFADVAKDFRYLKNMREEFNKQYIILSRIEPKSEEGRILLIKIELLDKILNEK